MHRAYSSNNYSQLELYTSFLPSSNCVLHRNRPLDPIKSGVGGTEKRTFSKAWCYFKIHFDGSHLRKKCMRCQMCFSVNFPTTTSRAYVGNHDLLINIDGQMDRSTLKRVANCSICRHSRKLSVKIHSKKRLEIEFYSNYDHVYCGRHCIYIFRQILKPRLSYANQTHVSSKINKSAHIFTSENVRQIANESRTDQN